MDHFDPRAALGLTCPACQILRNAWELDAEAPIPFWPEDDRPPF